MSSDIAVDWLLAAPGAAPERHDARIGITGSEITLLGPTAAPGNGLIALPGLINAHDHGRAINATPFGGFDKPLESWLFYLGLIPGIDAYGAAAVAFGRAALGGAGRVMLHYTRLQGLQDPVAEVRELARAASDVGVQVGFALALRDRHPVTYAETAYTLQQLPLAIRAQVRARLDRAPQPVAAQLALAEEIAAVCHGPGFNVQYGPTAVQWCSPELLQAIAAASADNGRQVHMHLLETPYQREWADHAYPDGIVTYLANIGLLSPRLTLAHCTWCRPHELALIAASGATIAVNTGSNLGLRSGIAPVGAMLAAGCRVALGIDGLALDEDDDALRELRLLYQLQKGRGYQRDVAPAQAWEIAARHGSYSVSGIRTSGRLAVGEPADLLLLDAGRLMEDRMFEDVPVFDFVLARANASHIQRVIVAGRTIVEQGKVLGIDYPGLRQAVLAELRAGLDPHDPWRQTVQQLDQAFKPFFEGRHHLGCC